MLFFFFFHYNPEITNALKKKERIIQGKEYVECNVVVLLAVEATLIPKIPAKASRGKHYPFFFSPFPSFPSISKDIVFSLYSPPSFLVSFAYCIVYLFSTFTHTHKKKFPHMQHNQHPYLLDLLDLCAEPQFHAAFL